MKDKVEDSLITQIREHHVFTQSPKSSKKESLEDH